MAEFDGLSDYFILQIYEMIRQEVIADGSTGAHFLGLPAKRRARDPRLEIINSGLFCADIDWPEHLEEAGGDKCEPTVGRRKTTSN